MRAVVQRVSAARVRVGDRIAGEIERGFVVLVGISHSDSPREADWLVEKVRGLRVFDDAEGKMNLSLQDVGGGVLLVSQFTLYGDARKGRRPSFVRAASGAEAALIYERCIEAFRAGGIPCGTGEFGASMQVELVNEGPVTILLDSEKTF